MIVYILIVWNELQEIIHIEATTELVTLLPGIQEYQGKIGVLYSINTGDLFHPLVTPVVLFGDTRPTNLQGSTS